MKILKRDFVLLLLKIMTKLCKLAYKYGTDKCPQISHPYTPFYYELFKDKRNSIKKVIEVGIGSRSTMHYHQTHYVTGASLYMWRDFFPNAQIYGVDILPETMLESERIETFLYDQTKKEDLEKLIEKTGSDIDIFVDDGLHSMTTQVNLCEAIMPMLKKDVIYIIEDVMWPNRIIRVLTQYDCFSPVFHGAQRKENVIIIKNKEID